MIPYGLYVMTAYLKQCLNEDYLSDTTLEFLRDGRMENHGTEQIMIKTERYIGRL